MCFFQSELLTFGTPTYQLIKECNAHKEECFVDVLLNLIMKGEEGRGGCRILKLLCM